MGRLKRMGRGVVLHGIENLGQNRSGKAEEKFSLGRALMGKADLLQDSFQVPPAFLKFSGAQSLHQKIMNRPLQELHLFRGILVRQGRLLPERGRRLASLQESQERPTSGRFSPARAVSTLVGHL